MELADQGVSEFRSQVDSEQYHAIYIGADDKFRRGSNETDFVALMQAVHRKLGKVQQPNLQNSQVGWFVGEGSIVTLYYDTQFAEGRASEKFIWRVKDNRPILVGYYINSNVLITK